MFRVPLNQQVALQHRQLHFENGMQEAGGPEMEKRLGSNRLAQEHEVMLEPSAWENSEPEPP